MKRVVVTGLGAISPIGNDVESMWKSAKNGDCGIDFITRFDTEEMKVKIAGEVKNFDPTLYMEKKEVRKTDLYTQFALGAATQAVKDSGILDNVAPERLGVYVGSGIGGMQSFINNCVALEKSGPKKVSPFFVPMMISNIASGTISINFNAKGVCLPIVTACATGTHSIGEAYHAVAAGYADAIITGGAEATINPLAISGFANCKALSTRTDPKDASTPFDKRRDGFVMGEGAGVIILEEYEHAVARGAKIYAEICGYGNSSDAHHITAPDPEAKGATQAIKIACAEAGITKEDAVYINAHGTSTPANDKTETLAIKEAFGEQAYDMYISSTKGMTGHMLGAAGGIEAVISILALKDGVLPPTIGYKEKDEECDLNYIPNKAIEKQVDYAVSTSLGFGGHNGCIVFKKYN